MYCFMRTILIKLIFVCALDDLDTSLSDGSRDIAASTLDIAEENVAIGQSHTETAAPTGKLPPLNRTEPQKHRDPGKSPKANHSSTIPVPIAEDVENKILVPKEKKKKKKRQRTSADTDNGARKPNETVETMEKNNASQHSPQINDDLMSQTEARPVITVEVDVERQPVDRLATHQTSSHLSVPRVPSISSLRTYENPIVDEDEVDTIEIISTPSPRGRYTKSPGQSILKTSSTSADITAMFQAGSRPTSANSTGKHSVRIADEVSYSSSKKPKTNRPTSSRPSSSRNGTRPKSSNGTRHKANGTRNPPNSNEVSRHLENGTNPTKLKQTTQRKISPHIKTSIFTLIACGGCLGVGALYFSLKSRRALKEGTSSRHNSLST